MPDCLSTIVDELRDSVGLPAMGHLEKLAFIFSRQEYYILRLRSLESTAVRVVHSLQHLGLSVAHEVYLRSLLENSTALE